MTKAALTATAERDQGRQRYAGHRCQAEPVLQRERHRNVRGIRDDERES